MGVRRRGDIPGEAIPQVYFDWVRRRDARSWPRVFEHNRQDIVSLAALAVPACRWVEEGRPRTRATSSAWRASWNGRGSTTAARPSTGARSTSVPGRCAAAALLRLASRAKRAGDHARAAALWAEAGEAGEVEGWRELAIHHEHRSRDLDAALAAVERGRRLVEPDAAGTRAPAPGGGLRAAATAAAAEAGAPGDVTGAARDRPSSGL